MFKANIIEGKSYYTDRRNSFLWMIVPSVLIGIIVNLFNFPVWVMVYFILFFIGVQVVRFNNIVKVKKASSHRTIELDESEIRIMNSNGGIESRFPISDIEGIKTNYDFSIPFETLESMKEEVTGKFTKNYLEFSNHNKEKRYEFELTTHYSIVQLKKLLEFWESKHLEISKLQ